MDEAGKGPWPFIEANPVTATELAACEPKVVEDLLDRGAVAEWRVEDAEAKAEKRRKAAYQPKLTRLSKKRNRTKKADIGAEYSGPELSGWEDFDVEGLLR